MIAFLEAKQAGLLRQKNWLKNLVAGLIVSVIALPLGMAFAIASGAKPEQGIYTSIIAGALVSIFGGSRFQIAGPTGAFIVLLLGISNAHGLEGLQIATIMAGLILVGLGLAKFGGVIKFIPTPVIVGFTAGIGVIIWLGQWQYFFGLPKTGGEHFHEKVWGLLEALPAFHIETTALAILSLLTIVFFPKIKRFSRIPSPLVAMAMATILQYTFQFDGVATIGSTFGGIPQALPSLTLPAWNWSRMVDLIGPAFTIAMLGAIESLLSAVVADGMTGTKHDSNQELIGQGLANICAPLLGGIAATGAIARTATNIRNGGNSPLSGIFHALGLVLILLFLSPLAAHIPLSAMAAILFVVSYNMSDIRHFVYMLRQAPMPDVVILVVTFFLTIFTDLVVAVNVGVLLAILHFMKNMATAIEVHKVEGAELKGSLPELKSGSLPKGLLVYAIEGPFFFGAVENFERALAHTNTYPHVLILRFNHVPFVDITALETLTEVIKKLSKKKVRVFITEANPHVRRTLHKAGILAITGKRMYWNDFAITMKKAEEIVTRLSTKKEPPVVKETPPTIH